MYVLSRLISSSDQPLTAHAFFSAKWPGLDAESVQETLCGAEWMSRR